MDRDLTVKDIKLMQVISATCYNKNITDLVNEKLQNVVNTLMVIQETVDNYDL